MEDNEAVMSDVKYTDSQKSVTTSNAYSPDFTDSSSDRNVSSGKETYVIEESDTDSEKTYEIHSDESIVNLNKTLKNRDVKQELRKTHINRSAATSLQKCTIGEETCTQTSKTILEISRNEMLIQNKLFNNTLETQTSFASFKEVKYTIQVSESKPVTDNSNRSKLQNSNHFLASLKEKSLIFENSEAKKIPEVYCDNNSCEENVIRFINDESTDKVSSELYNETLDENTSKESSNIDSDMEADSLMENEYRQSHGNDSSSETSDAPDSFMDDVEKLYQKITANTIKPQPMATLEPGHLNFEILTPLSEEPNRNDHIVDVTPSVETLSKFKDEHEEFRPSKNDYRMGSFTNNNRSKGDALKLPPIYKNQSCPNSPLVNSLYSIRTPGTPFKKSEALPSVFERQQRIMERWCNGTQNLASGEKPPLSLTHGMNDDKTLNLLPPLNNKYNTPESSHSNANKPLKDHNVKEICIRGRIKDLKMSNLKNRKKKVECRSCSPTISTSSPEDSKLCDAAEKGCDALCCELLRLLRSRSWKEVAETLEYLPTALHSFWCVMSENRIADLLRQLTTLVESPRTKVARSACDALAQVLKNTSYIRKPDFYEAIASLLTKTSSYSRPVRSAANVALDTIVCHVELTHALTAICIYGIEHKSPLVRCASSRLLVVCCALAEGGRQILRSRPPTAATARRHALHALSLLLQDKNLETRKYAERLYSMLRPLPNFEAYFVSDVDVEVATSQMKKYDAILNANAKEGR